MCFSATASFTLGSILLIGGTYAMVRAVKETPDFVAIAAYPIAFGIQQIFEGGVWVNLLNGSVKVTQIPAFGFLFFSHLFWPLWVPLSIWWLEKRSFNKRLLLPVFLTEKAIGKAQKPPYQGLNLVFAQSRNTTVCGESSCLHQNQLDWAQKAIYLA